MAGPSGLRIGDADREAAVASLREHYAHGRLTLEEFKQRLDVAFAARTDRDLAGVTRDLPHATTFAPPRAVPPPTTPPGAGGAWSRGGYGWGPEQDCWQGPRPQTRPSGVASLVLLVIALLVITGLFLPFGFGLLLPKPILLLLAIVAFGSRLLRRVVRGGRPVRSRGRRWRP